MSPEIVVLIFGDSIAEGLGARGRGYAEILREDFGYRVINCSVSGSTVKESYEAFLRDELLQGDVALICHGITEPILRPDPSTLRWAPSRWQRRGWMDPRAYFSSRLSRRVLERIESSTRWRVKNVAIRRHAMQLLSLGEFLEFHSKFRDALAARGARALAVEPTHIDARYFPGSDAEQERYWHALKATGVESVDTRDALIPWGDYLLDHFHPNETGHEKLARRFDAEIRAHVHKH